RRVMSDIIEPRVEEIFCEVRRRMEEAQLVEQMSSGVVLTGGAVLMEGIVEAAEEILGMPVRLGFPIGVKGIVQLVQGPQYAAGVGLVRYGAKKLEDLDAYAQDAGHVHPAAMRAAVAGDRRGFWGWLREAF